MTVVENATRILEAFERGKNQVASPNPTHDVMIEVLFDLSEDFLQQHPCVILRFKNTFSITRASHESRTLAFLQEMKSVLFEASLQITRPWTQTAHSTYERADYRGTNDCVQLYIQDRNIPIECSTQGDKLILSSNTKTIPHTLKQFEAEIG